MPQIVGGCLCGKVRYSANAEPAFVGVCHCTDCQKVTGSAFSVIVAVPKPVLKIEGKLATYSKAGDTGKTVERRFCPECGSSVIDEASALPDVVMLSTGTLDDASWVKPSMEIFCDSAQSWVHLQGDMQRFPKMPG